jgi:hypothetical protein
MLAGLCEHLAGIRQAPTETGRMPQHDSGVVAVLSAYETFQRRVALNLLAIGLELLVEPRGSRRGHLGREPPYTCHHGLLSSIIN